MRVVNLNILGLIMSLTGNNTASADPCSCGDDNTPGVETKLYLVPECEVLDFPGTLADTAAVAATPVASMADYVTLDGDILLNAIDANLGYWREYDIIVDSGKVLDTLVGEDGSKSFDSDIPFRIAGTQAEQLGFAKCVSNCPYIAMIKTKTGIYRVVGKPGSPAKFQEIVLDTGDTPSSANQGTYLLRANTGCPGLVYNGVIDLTPNP